MACVALSSLMATIELEFLQPVSRVSLRDEASIKSFFQKLSSLQDFLEESSGGAAAIQYLETIIRDFALKAEDGIEIQISKFLLAKDPENKENAFQKLQQTLREAAGNAAELLKIIKNTSNEDDKANENQPIFWLKHASDSENVKSDGFKSRSNEGDKANESQPPIRWLKHASDSKNVKSEGSSRHPSKLEDRMVGRDHDCRVIIDRCFRGGSKRRLISIVGMAGIGKTTLARSVYEDPSAARRFDVQCWITMPQEYNQGQMLFDLLQSISPEKSEKRITLSEMALQVYRRLKLMRYLIVLDNFWNNSAWDDIHRCLPDDKNGSCILLTTRHFNRDYYPGFYIHNMTLLDSNESWALFCNTLSHNKRMAPKFEKIRSPVVEKCDGLPLLIVAVAKRLSKCNNIQQGWKKVEKELESLGILDRGALTLSYDQLPQHLKVCFLYLGVFPKRNEILVKMLIRLWVAEGFVKLENRAYGYLQELIDRSLILIGNKSSDGKIKTCRMHSGLHSFCIGEALKGGIFCALSTLQHPGLSLDAFANSSRWLSLCEHSFDYYVLFSTNKPRSIFFFLENQEMIVTFQLLRVLAFVPCTFFERVPTDLVFLRYLSITQWCKGLDYIVSSNPNLQTLIVSLNRTSPFWIDTRFPSKIWESPQLRHLEVSYSLSVDPPSEVREGLHTLCWLTLDHCTEEVFSRIPKVKKLGIICGGKSNPNGVESDNLDNLGRLDKLETLMIAFPKGSPSGFQNLNSLPQQLNIKKLKLKRTSLPWSEINVISMLPILEVLKLKEVSDDSDWGPTEGNFGKLKFLFLEARNLVWWEISGVEQFPCLERLVLKRCTSLEAIPIGFADSITLESIELQNCSPAVLASAKEINDTRKDCGYEDVAIRHVDQIQEGVEDDDDSL